MIRNIYRYKSFVTAFAKSIMNFSERAFVMLSLNEPCEFFAESFVMVSLNEHYEFFTKVEKTQKNVSVCQC